MCAGDEVRSFVPVTEPENDSITLIINIIEPDETIVYFRMEFRFSHNMARVNTQKDRMDLMMDELIDEGTFHTQKHEQKDGANSSDNKLKQHMSKRMSLLRKRMLRGSWTAEDPLEESGFAGARGHIQTVSEKGD
jgi:hypothetical protein